MTHANASSPLPIGVLIVTHGGLAAELAEAARVIVCQETELPLRALSVGWNDPMDEARELVRSALSELDQGAGLLILTDMFGGTPTNLCLSFLEEGQVELVTGVNLPMVVKSMNLAKERASKLSLREVAERVAERGAKSVIVAGQALDHEAPDHEGG